MIFVRNRDSVKANQLQMAGMVGGLELTGGNFGTGTASADINGYQMVFTGEEQKSAPFLTAYTDVPFDNFDDITVSPAY